MGSRKVLVYPMRRDLRVADNPILDHLATTDNHGFTDVLPIYVFESHLIEISGFIDAPNTASPYPAARSRLAKFWRCGPHRAKFTAQSVWDLKLGLEAVEVGLAIRVGKTVDVLKHMLSHFGGGDEIAITAVWMTEDSTTEEIAVQNEIAALCTEHKLEFRLWADEKYLIDDRDTGLQTFGDVPNIFTWYRKSQEPLREKPRATLPRPLPGSLPNFPDLSMIPKQPDPFMSAESLVELEARLLKPLNNILYDPPQWPEGIETSHPFAGGESAAWDRLTHLVKSNFFWTYQQTSNGLVGMDFSSKLSAYLSLGCITARQIHGEMLAVEDGTKDAYKEVRGFGRGESMGMALMRFELLWRDYMRLCALKFGSHLFRVEGYHDKKYSKPWLAPLDASDRNVRPTEGIDNALKRLFEGTTGLGFIDASQRELYNTGYTSNRARQNVANFITKHLNIDWRYGAEWYESLLVDYDVASNWGNWQYVAGVGNDPRGDARVFHPVKQSFKYDRDGSYIKKWMPELRTLQKLENIFQACTASPEALAAAGLTDNIMVTNPLKHVIFDVGRWAGQTYNPRHRSPESKIHSDTLNNDYHSDGLVDDQGRACGGHRSSRGRHGSHEGQRRTGAAGGDRGRDGHAGHAANGHHINRHFNGHQANGYQGNGFMNDFIDSGGSGGGGGNSARGAGRKNNRGGRNGRGSHGLPRSRARSHPEKDSGTTEPGLNGGGAGDGGNYWANRLRSWHKGWRDPFSTTTATGTLPGRRGEASTVEVLRTPTGGKQGRTVPDDSSSRLSHRTSNARTNRRLLYPTQFFGYQPNVSYNFNRTVSINPFVQQPVGQVFEPFLAHGFPMPWGGFGQWTPSGGFMEHQQQQPGPQQGHQGPIRPPEIVVADASLLRHVPHNLGPAYPGG